MLKFSFKQLFRQSGKAVLFFLLMAASTALVVTGTVMSIENTRRIQIVEDTYSTIGMIEQGAVNVEVHTVPDPCYGTYTFLDPDYGRILSPDVLDFPGADYITPPENRPYYVSYLPDFSHTERLYLGCSIVEFTPLDTVEGGGPVEVKVTKVIYSDIDGFTANVYPNYTQETLHEGDRIYVCQHGRNGAPLYPYTLEEGLRYVGEVRFVELCETHDKIPEYRISVGPHSYQRDSEGNLIDHGCFPEDVEAYRDLDPRRERINQVVGEDFYEKGNPGYNYVQWAEQLAMVNKLFITTPTNSLNLLPSWHSGTMYLAAGREITPEEFDQGAAVCMIPQYFAEINQLTVGDVISLPFLCSRYGTMDWLGFGYTGQLEYNFSLLDADGEFYEPFWEAEYEIVGTYAGGYGESDVMVDMLVIPSKSVGASDENNIAWFTPMCASTASFEIPNGKIEEFDAALKAAVPEAESLTITYDDRGYMEMMKSLNSSRNMAFLLLLVGVLAALAIVILLLYFFVVKERKRTAIERSLGMTRKQCRVSLLAGLMVLTVIAAALGSLCGMLTLDTVESSADQTEEIIDVDSRYVYSTQYSLWAQERNLAESTEIEAEAPVEVYIVVPLLLCVLVLMLSLLLVERSFTIDPIYLLSTKGKE